MTLPEIIFLGFIQGLTEFFPVSSSGHLVFFQNVLGIREPQIFIDIMLHVGTLLALLVYLKSDIRDIIRSLFRLVRNSESFAGDPNRILILDLFLASIPTFLMGYFFSDFFESLFSSVRAVGGALVITSIFLWLTRYSRPSGNRKWFHSIIVGIMQGAAIVPGFSRSGFTIGGALLLGWRREESARFSFLLSIPAILGATVFQLGRIGSNSPPWFIVAVGVAAAAVSGYAALKFLAAVVRKGRFFTFSIYCLPMGAAIIIISYLI